MDPWFRCGPLSARLEDGRTLYDRVTVRLGEAEFALLEGPSGAGKTTLLRAIAGLDPAESAERTLGGEAFPASALPSWRARVTWLAQDAPMLPGSVRENLAFPFRHRAGQGRRLDEGRARELLVAVGLGDLPWNRDARDLSGGERHRLALVRGMLWDPPVLLADEPFTGLDPDRARACRDLLAAWARRPGHAALVVLHDPELGRGADRRLVLQGGRLREGEPRA